MFISPAYAQAAGGAADPFGFLIPMVLIFVVFWFLLIRPQQKRAKQHREMLAAIRRGDKVVTNGGIIGTVTKVVDDGELLVEIAEGIRVRVQRGMIAAVRAKTEPVRDQPRGGGGTPTGQPQQDEGIGAKIKGFLGGGRG